MLKPRMPVRRFDVFAEYTRQKALQKGTPSDEAKGYGLWVAKVVASGGGRSSALRNPPGKGKGGDHKDGAEEEGQAEKGPKWHTLGDEEQTDELFEKEIVKRMGEHFYETVFVPAIEEAVAQDRTYQSIRDTIRRDWKP